MGSLLIFIIIVVALSLIIVGWVMVLEILRERKIAEMKTTFMQLAGEEQNKYQHYIQAEKTLQEAEIEIQRSKEIIVKLKARMRERKKELRELIEQLRLVRSRIDSPSANFLVMNLELNNTEMTSRLESLLMFNNKDKIRITAELAKTEEKKGDLPYLTKKSAQLGENWDKALQNLEQVANKFRSLDINAWNNFAESYSKIRSEKSKLDPERDLINMILLLNNKKGLLYMLKKEMAKDPNNESSRLVKKYEVDIKKLEVRLRNKSRSMGISPTRLNKLKNLFLK